MQVLARLPRLKSLDGVAVTPEEREAAPVAVQHEAMMLELMVSNACLLHRLVTPFSQPSLSQIEIAHHLNVDLDCSCCFLASRMLTTP